MQRRYEYDDPFVLAGKGGDDGLKNHISNGVVMEVYLLFFVFLVQ